MIAVFAVRPQSPVFDEASFKMKRVPMYEHLSNKFQHIYCRSIESAELRSTKNEL